jgi:DNA-binding winged helix-turn-helix (wHTH) protein/Tfp pilus assembly protein PilF
MYPIRTYQIASDRVLCTRTNSLTYKGEIIELEHRLVSLLVYFIDHQNEVLRKELLLKTIWKGKVVNDDSLAVAISHLRKALGDNSRAPQFIKTLPGIGYQFIATAQALEKPAEEINPIDAAATPESITSSSITIRKKSRQIIFIASSLLLVLFISAVFYPQQKPSVPTASKIKPPIHSAEWLKDYQLANNLLSTNEPDNWRLAIKKFRNLLHTEGESAELYVGIANAKMQLLTEKISIKENCIEVIGLLEKSLALNPDIATTHRSLANATFWCQRDYVLAEQHYLTAIKLNPNDDVTLIFYAQLLLAQHRFNESLAQTEQARRLNPLNYSAPDVVWIMQMQGRDDLAIRELNRILSTEPDNRYYHISAQRIYNRMGDSEKTFAQWQWLMRDAGFSATDLNDIEIHFKQGGLPAVNDWLLTHKITADIGEYSPPLSWARYALAAKKYDIALDYIEAAYAQRQSAMLWVSIDPAYEPVYNHPRFQKIVAQLKEVENK